MPTLSGKNEHTLISWLIRHQKLLVWLAIISSVLFWTAVGFWKYRLNLYNAFDLAYFNQVFWNSLNGRWFEQSLHPHLSLGDHAGLILPLLVPVYALWDDPRMLLLMQQTALAACAWPVYWLAKAMLARLKAEDGWLKLGPLVLAMVWVIHPSVHGMGLFEFHLLPFALFPLFMSLLAFERKRLKTWLFWSLLAMLVREDVALAVAAVGLLAWIERRPPVWRWLPPVMAGAWFFAAMSLISRFAPAGSYKFAVYYAWLGDTPWQALVGALRRPVEVLAHLVSLANLEMLLGLTMSLLLVPFLAPRYLVLAILPFLQLSLSSAGGGELVVDTHYAVLFLPAVFMAGIAGSVRLVALIGKDGVLKKKAGLLAAGLIIAAAGFTSVLIGPAVATARLMLDPGETSLERAETADRMLARIGPEDSVAASIGLLPKLSSRQQLYKLESAFLGQTQFGFTAYELPPDTRFLAIDSSEFLTYQAQMTGDSWQAARYDKGFPRLRRAAGSLAYELGHYQLYDSEQGSYVPVLLPAGPGIYASSQEMADGLRLENASVQLLRDLDSGQPLLEVITAWSSALRPDGNWQWRLRLIDDGGNLAWERKYPFGNGLVSAADLSRKPIAFRIKAPLGGLAPGQYRVQLATKETAETAHLNDIGSVGLRKGGWRVLGTATLGTIHLK